MTVVPVPVTKLLVISNVTTVESSSIFLIYILPVSTSTSSLKVNTILVSIETPTASSSGDLAVSVGFVLSSLSLIV